MEISNIGNTSMIREIWMDIASELEDVELTNSSTETDEASSLVLSKRGELFSKLQQLAESDPDKFTEMMNSAADELEAEAAEMEDEESANRLLDMAEKFREAAETGDVSTLRPQPPPPPGGAGGQASGIMQYLNQSEGSGETTLLDLLLQYESEGTGTSDIGEFLTSLLSDDIGSSNV